MLVFWELRKTTQKLKTWQGKNECKDCEPAPIQDWSVDSRVRAFLASDQVCADKAVRAPVSPFLESALILSRGGSAGTTGPGWPDPLLAGEHAAGHRPALRFSSGCAGL